MTLDEQAKFITDLQRALREAEARRDKRALERGAGMIDGPEFTILPERVQEDILAQYAGAMLAVTGAFS